MTDATTPGDRRSVPDEPDRPHIPEEPDDRSGERTPAGDDTPGSPTSAEPLTDSADGGLDGGDPGVEE